MPPRTELPTRIPLLAHPAGRTFFREMVTSGRDRPLYLTVSARTDHLARAAAGAGAVS